MKRAGLLCSALLIMSGFAFGSGHEEATTAAKTPASQIIPITVAVQPAFDHGLLYMAKDRGWDKQAGLDMHLILFESGMPQEEAMASGKVDISMIGSTAAIIGAQSKLVGQWVFNVAAGVTPLFTIISDRPDVKNPGDLKGKTVLVTPGSSMQYFLDMALEKYGLTEKDVNIMPMQPSDAQVAFLAGNGDAIVPLAPQIWVLTSKSKDAKIIFDGSQLATPPGKIVKTKMIDLIVATKKFANDNPVAMTRFQNLWFKCVDYINSPATRKDAITAIQEWKNKQFNAGLTYSEAKWMIDRYQFFNAKQEQELFSSGNVANSLTREAGFYVASKKIPDVPAAADYITGKIIDDYLSNTN